MAPKKATPHASSRQTSGEYLKRVARSSGIYEPMRSRYVSALNRIWRALRYMRWPEAPPLHRDEQFEPFFIVGSGRCGTTLLRRLLMESSEAHIPPENWRLKDVIPCFKRYQWTVEWNDLSRLAVNYFAHQGEYNPDKTINKWFDGRSLKPLIDELEAIPSEEQSLARLIDHLYRYHGRVRETKVLRWGDKTPLNVWNMNQISEVFPDAKFVHLLRDGTDVAASFIKAGPPRSASPPYAGNQPSRRPATSCKSIPLAASKFATKAW